MTSNLIRFIISILICQMAGIIGSIFTAPQIQTWYATLSKPAFSPPNWVFAPVWTTLFFLMGISLFIVWGKSERIDSVKLALWAFGIQLLLNVLWSALFFGLHSPLAGLVDIIFLWVAIVLTLVLFYPISRVATVLLVPYLVWVSFASILNFSLWRLNP